MERSTFRRDVQGLRAVAVLAVIAGHLFQWPAGGFVGVDVFFVISGYLITGLLLREHARTGTVSLRRFYVRRARRIVPASVLVLCVTIGASYLLFSGSRARATAVDAVWSFFFAGNWRFAIQGADYFQQGLPPSPVQHFWSLAVEEQFYLVWPWLMLALLTVGARRVRWSQRQRSVAVGATIGAIALISFAWAMHQGASDPAVAYFSTFTRVWELAVGGLLAVAGSALTIRSAARRAVLGWVGLVGVFAAVFLVPWTLGSPAPWVALPVLATALVIVSGHGDEQRRLWPLTNPVSRYLGDISYSLYLWHFPVTVLLLALLPGDGALYYGAGAVLVLGLAIASYHVVEDPLRKSSWVLPTASRRDPDRGTRWPYVGWGLLGAAGTAVLVIGVLLPVTPNAASTVATPLSDQLPARSTQSTQTGADCLGAAAMDPGRNCDQAVESTAVTPSVDLMDVDSKGAFDCWTDQNAPLRTCTYGAKGTGAVSVALIGDSHAAMLLPGLKQQLLANGWRLDTYLGWECQWTLGAGSECATALAQIQQRLELGPRYDIVITTGARHKSGKDKAWVSDQMARAWQPVADRGTKIVVVGDNPGVSEGALDCVRRVGFSVADGCATLRSEALAETDALIRAASLVRGAYLVDLTSFFCDTTQCPAVIGDVITYWDTEGHITGTFSQTLGPHLVTAVRKAAT